MWLCIICECFSYPSLFCERKTNSWKLRIPLHPSHLLTPPNSDRSSTQFFSLQHGSISQLISGRLHHPALRISSIHPTALPFRYRSSFCFGEEGSCDHNAGANFCICSMEQGLHESSTYFSHHEEVLGIDEFLKVLSLVYDLLTILPPQFLSS